WQNDPHPDREGWKVYTWSEELKGKSGIKISLPPEIIAIFEETERLTTNEIGFRSKWAFPQVRYKYVKRFAGPEKSTDNCIDISGLSQHLAALGGRKSGWPNLLKIVGLPERISPHDFRRSVANYFDNIGEAALASALLDHQVSAVDKFNREVAQITQGVYSAADRVHMKAEALLKWMSAVNEGYESALLNP